MILTGDYHTHTPYSHGKNTVMENVLAASKLGIKTVAITDHGFNHIVFGLRRRKLEALRLECTEAERATGIKVLMGMESNVISRDGHTDMKESDFKYFDIYLCGLHEALWYESIGDFFNLAIKNYMVTKLHIKPSERLVKTTTKALAGVVKNNPVDILTHVGFRSFCDPVEVAKCCADYGTYFEINSKKYHISAEDLANVAAKTNVRFIIDSDAHSAARVGDTKIAEDVISRSGIPIDRIDNIDGREPKFRFSEYKRRHV